MTTIEPGDTFLYPYPGDIKHLHIIIEKIIDKNVCLCVFVSSIRSGKGYDASCVLNAGDCRSTISYLLDMRPPSDSSSTPDKST